MKLAPFIGAALACMLTVSISIPAQATTLTSPPPASETDTSVTQNEEAALEVTSEAAPAPEPPAAAPIVNKNVNVEIAWTAPFNRVGHALPNIPFTNTIKTRFTSEENTNTSGTIRVYRTQTVNQKTAPPTLLSTYKVAHTGKATIHNYPVKYTHTPNFTEGKVAYYATYTPNDDAPYTDTSITETQPLTYNHKMYPTKVVAPWLDGKPASVNKGLTWNVHFKIDVSPTEFPRPVILETSTDNGKTWKTGATRTMEAVPEAENKAPGATVPVYISQPIPPGGMKYRVRIPTSGNQQAVTTAGTLHITDKNKQRLSTFTEETLIVPWRTNTLVINPTGYNGANIKVEELNGKTWKTIKTYKLNTKKPQIRLALPKGTVNSGHATKQYRTTIAGNASHHAISHTSKVTWENPRKYTGDRLRVYNSFKDKCPTALVRSAKPMKGVWATAVGRTQIITVHGYIPNNHIRTVGLHECAHIKQYEAYKNKGGGGAMDKRLNQLFGTRGSLGVEQSADCIANIWKRNSYWAYKGSKKCNGARLASAKAIIAGKTY